MTILGISIILWGLVVLWLHYRDIPRPAPGQWLKCAGCGRSTRLDGARAGWEWKCSECAGKTEGGK
jgi:hypothetical protein